MIKAVIFDLDGVIVVSDPGQFKVLQKVFRKKGLILPERTYPQLIGRTTRAFLAKVKPPKNRIEEIYTEYKKEFQGNLLKHVVSIKPTVRFIANYNGPLKIALASMSSMETIVKETKHFKVYKKFERIVSRDEIMNHKPDPEIYLLTARKLGLKPQECAVVEDSVLGVQAARRAGMRCYVFLNGMNKRFQFSRFKVNGFIQTARDYKRYFTM